MVIRILFITLTFWTITVVKTQSDFSLYTVPQPELEALENGGFRVYIPDTPGINMFAFHGNINKGITPTDPGQIYGETKFKESGYWIINFENKLKANDQIHFWVFVSYNRLGYRKDGDTWHITLSDAYKRLSNTCEPSSTTVDGQRVKLCLGDTLFEDYFNGRSVDTNLWNIEQKIPTYSEPNFEFNTYENRNDTLFLRDGKLFIKPIALMNENEVRGTLDLRQGCTSDIQEQCYYRHASSFLLSPVKSSKITLKHSFQYANIEIKAKLPAGDWIVPVIEIEPKDKSEGPNGPKLWIAYSRGNDHLDGHGKEDIGGRVFFAGPVLQPAEPIRSAKLKKLTSDKRYSDDFHTFGFYWSKGYMSFVVDGRAHDYINTGFGFSDPHLGIGAHWNVSEAPFNKEYVLSLGVAVGGINDFPDDYSSPNDPKPWINGERNYVKKFFDSRNVWLKTWKGDNTALQIDYIKITTS